MIRGKILGLIGVLCTSLLLLHHSYNLLNVEDFVSPFTEAVEGPSLRPVVPVTLDNGGLKSRRVNGRTGQTISLIVRMKGEMSNLISYLVFAKGIQWWAEENYHMQFDLIGERQAGAKWKSAVNDLQMCFPNLRSIHFQGGRWEPDFRVRRQQQRDWVGEDNKTKLIIDRADSDCGTKEWFCLHKQLAFLRQLRQQSIPNYIGSNSTRNENYSLPFLISDQQASFDVLVDQYFLQIKEWLAFDFTACCSPEQPDPDEIVFHLRNFRAEMAGRNYFEKGYEELSPQQVAQELLGHLQPGSKIAIASRGEEYLQSYVEALKERGFHVRTTPPTNSGVQDFCFLLQAQKELVGTMRSTYTRWAALLGKAEKVQLYSMDSPFIRQAHGTPDRFPSNLHYQWRRPDLHTKIHYRIFASNATP